MVGGSFTAFLTNILNILTGPMGQTISAIAIAFGAIGLMLHIIRIQTFTWIITGILILFSAQWWVSSISGGTF